MNIERLCLTQSLKLQTDDTSPIVDMSNFSGGFVFIVDAITTLTYFVAAHLIDPANPEMKPDTRMAANDQNGVAITQTVSQNNAYQIPAALFGAGFVQIRANAGNANVRLTLKS